jgi:hypothetical protein
MKGLDMDYCIEELEIGDVVDLEDGEHQDWDGYIAVVVGGVVVNTGCDGLGWTLPNL